MSAFNDLGLNARLIRNIEKQGYAAPTAIQASAIPLVLSGDDVMASAQTGTGKPAAVVTTMIFGGTPVVRLTVLGLRGVPESVREAAISFGANKWFLLTKVDLPLASPSIRAGINQTIMLSLAMVVVASLIGAKGLGEDVLEALQYANVGQGILAGFSILFCAMILDRIVQGGRK